MNAFGVISFLLNLKVTKRLVYDNFMCHFNLFLFEMTKYILITALPREKGAMQWRLRHSDVLRGPIARKERKKSSCPSVASAALLAPACGNGSQNIGRRSLTAYHAPHCISCVKHSLPVEPLLQQPDDIRFPVIQPPLQLGKRDQPVRSPALQCALRDVQLLHHILSINPVGPLRQIHFFHRCLLSLKWNKSPTPGCGDEYTDAIRRGSDPGYTPGHTVARSF